MVWLWGHAFKKTLAPASSSSAGLGAKMRSENCDGYYGYAVEVQDFSLKDPLNHAQKTCSHILKD